ncbi:MAG: hypothetical protein HY319_26785 [Armatimonadetes bacterium]|nr:hypothetical protein [Armatimonadota bacterium]
MKIRRMLTLLVLLLLVQPALAQKGTEIVKLEVVKKEVGGTSNPELQLYHFTVRITNLTGKPFQFTNNHFALKEASGRVHLVSRFRFPEGVFLEPGKPVSLDRIYFELPRDARPELLVLFRGRRVLGKVAL